MPSDIIQYQIHDEEPAASEHQRVAIRGADEAAGEEPEPFARLLGRRFGREFYCTRHHLTAHFEWCA